MRDTLGINLRPEVLPLGNTPGIYAPYFLSPERVYAVDDGRTRPSA